MEPDIAKRNIEVLAGVIIGISYLYLAKKVLIDAS